TPLLPYTTLFRSEHDRLPTFAVAQEPTEHLHRWITKTDPPLRVIWYAPPKRYCEGSGTNGADASTVTGQLRSLHGVGPLFVGHVTTTLTFATPMAACITT